MGCETWHAYKSQAGRLIFWRGKRDSDNRRPRGSVQVCHVTEEIGHHVSDRITIVSTPSTHLLFMTTNHILFDHVIGIHGHKPFGNKLAKTLLMMTLFVLFHHVVKSFHDRT